MSKRVKNLLRRDILERLGQTRDLAVVSVVGVDGVTNNRLRGELLAKGIRVMVVKNSMARQAFEEMGLRNAGELLDGACALAYGGEGIVSVVREVLERARTIPQLAVKGAFMEGEVFGPDRVEELSKYPTRVEAIGRVIAAARSAGGNVVGAITGPGAILAGILKTLQDKAGPEAPAEGAAEGAAATEVSQ